jgi:CzcA family heavy metal efflux pump
VDTGNRKGILGGIVRFSLRFKGIIIALAVVTFCYSLYSLYSAKYDVFPDFAPPQVTVHAEAPGLSPEEVEALVTRPIETALTGVQDIESMRSTSIQGFSNIAIAFKTGGDIYLARQMVSERLASVGEQLPTGVRPPAMTPLTSSTSVALLLGLTSDTLSLTDLRILADWSVTRTLLAVPGVAKIAVFGGGVKQIQIQVRPERLIRHRLSLGDVLAAARRATGVRGAGFLDSGNQQMTLRTERRQLSPGQIGGTVVLRENGTNVTLSDVATVTYAPAPPISAGAIMGKPGVLLEVSAQYRTNTVEVTKRLGQAIEALRPMLAKEGVTLYPALFRPADFVERAIRNVRFSLIVGGVLVIVILFLFLLNLRTAAISCTAIPLSLLAAIMVLERMGYSLNTMTLGGLAIAIGEVVDDAVIDVENIFRRLRENRLSEDPLPSVRVIFDASLEVRSAVVYATFAVVLVFIPILTVSGVAGRIFAPLGLAYILAVLASLGIALTVTPALCLLLLGRRDYPQKEPPFTLRLKERYRRSLLAVEKHPGVVIAIIAILTTIVLGAAPFFLKGEFMPQLKEGNFIVHVSSLPGTSLRESLRIGGRVTNELLALPFVNSCAQRVGRAEQGEETRGPNSGEISVGLKPSEGVKAEDAAQQIRRVMSQFPGITYSVKTFLSERIEETVSGYAASEVVNIYGDDLDTIAEKAQEVASVLKGVRGASEAQVQTPPTAPEVVIKLRDTEIARWGFAPGDVIDAIGMAYQGTIVGEVYEGDRVFDVSVILDPQDRQNAEDIDSLPLRNPSGTYVFLRQIADIYEASGLYSLMHSGGRRVQTVTCNIRGRDFESFRADAQKQISSRISFPPGTYVEFAGTATEQARSRRDLVVHSLLAALGIVILLSVVAGHRRNVLLLILNLPFALVGGMLMVFASGGRLSLGSMVGFVTLFGITLRNSIMLLSHYEHLVQNENMPWGLEAALRGASERLVPILMTASVTAFGLLPLAVGSGTAGREIEGPMALVILGGLITSTALNLLVLPTLALRYGRFKRKTEQI